LSQNERGKIRNLCLKQTYWINYISDILNYTDCIPILFCDFDEFRDAIELILEKNNSVDILRV